MSKRKLFDGEKSVLDVRKSEERELSEQIYQNLQLLNIIYPPSYDLQKSLTPDMFIRPNTKAFPFVMHYLFSILDPVEFKKRFYWPIDRTSENAFRTTAVQYLNHLNEKYNLGWGEVKAFLVVMPGGIKFMKLLADLIDLAISEDIKKVERSHPEIVAASKVKFTKENVEKAVKKHENFLNKATEYKQAIEAKKKLLKEKTEKLNRALTDVCDAVGISVEDASEHFAKMFAKNNEKLFDTSVVKKVDDLEKTEKCLDDLSSEIDKFFNPKREKPFDSIRILASYRSIQKDYPSQCMENLISSNNQIDLAALLTAFTTIFPTLEVLVTDLVDPERLKEKFVFEQDEMKKLESETMQFEVEMFKIENGIEDVKTNQSSVNVSTPDKSVTCLESKIKTKFINTPVICLQNERPISKMRIPLFESNAEESFSITDQTVAGSRVNHKSGGISKISDPLNLIRTVTKLKTRQRHNTSNLSLLASRFKENQATFYSEKRNLSQTVIGTMGIEETPVARPNQNNEVCIVQRRDALRGILLESHHYADTMERPTPELGVRRKSIGDVSRNQDIDAVSRSPLGRFTSVAKFKELSIPEIQIDDPSMDCSHVDFPDIEGSEPDTVLYRPHVNKEKITPISETTVSPTTIEIEKLCSNFQKDINLEDETESIFNISDTVLNDVSY